MAFLYSILASILVSAISLIWIFFIILKHNKILEKWLIYLVWFSTWAMLWDVFIHLLPEAFEQTNNISLISIFVLIWILSFFVIEKFIHWRHCHNSECSEHNEIQSHLWKMNLIWDFFHNFIDWIIIAWAFIIDVKVWIATTIAIILHEIPQEIWDFWVLLHAWYTKKKALLLNFASGLASVIWVLLTFAISSKVDNLTTFLVPFAAWSFIYIAWTDLIPELHKHNTTKKSIFQFIAILIWIAIMFSLLLLE